jgi:predicted RecB family nuclease
MDLSAAFGKHPLRAKFDLIVHQGDTLHAIDWKTGRLPSGNLLKNRMQTVLYLYILYHRAQSLLADRPRVIKLEYVGIADGKNYIFTVDSTSLNNYAERIQECIDAVFQSDFSKVDDWQPCKFCLYRGLCERGQSPLIYNVNEVDVDWGLDIGESLSLEEIEF